MTRDIIWQAGQRFVAGFEGTKVPDDIKKLVREHKVGNVILFRRNVESRQQLKRLCADLQELIRQETGLPALIAIDQEGGTMSRLPEDCAVAAAAMALSAAGEPEYARQAGEITGRELAAMGVNFNLAPVMDVNSNPANPVIGARSYGDVPETVAAYGVEMIRGLQSAGVMSCAKHFPGHGDTAVDSHLDLPCVDKTLAELEKCELIPFQAAVEAGVSAIMTTHILFPQIEKQRLPATMSRTIMQEVLRKRLGYKGLIISDCMMMDAIARFYGTVEGSVTACNAGVDLICICHDPELTGRACQALVEQGDPAMMEAAVQRIVAAKEALMQAQETGLDCVGSAAHRRVNEQHRRLSITPVGAPLPSLGEKPYFVGSHAFVASMAITPVERSVCFPTWMHKELGGSCRVTDIDPVEGEIAQAVAEAREASTIVLCTFNAHMKPGQQRLLRALAALNKPMIVCAMRDPYDLMNLPAHISGLVSYEYSMDTLRILREVLTGRFAPVGRLPVRL